MEEIWRDIEGYEGLYQVSNLGRVKSLWGRYNKGSIKLIKPQLSKRSGYYQTGLTDKSGKQFPYTTHYLVARAFPEICGEWFEGAVVHHCDFDRTNNIADNLIVVSREEHNRIHHNSTITKQRRFDGQANRPDCSKRVIQYSLSMEYIDEYPSTMEAQRRTGINRSKIGRCANGKQKFSGGYIWKFA